MIDREHHLPIRRQAGALGIGRGSVCHKPRPATDKDLLTMRRMDELRLNREVFSECQKIVPLGRRLRQWALGWRAAA